MLSAALIVLTMAVRVHSSSNVVYDFDLNNMFYYGSFSDYDSVTVSITSDSSIDFWVTDEQNFNLWMDQETIPTAKMFKNNYCSNCVTHSTTFINPTPGNGHYYWVISAVFPERTDADGTISLNYVGSGSFDEPVEEEDSVATCFSGAATVQLACGAVLSLRELQPGDAVLALDTDGSAGFSRVLAVPHAGAASRRYATFFQIHHQRTNQEMSEPLEVTRHHLLPTCPQQPVGADDDPCSACSAAGPRLNPLIVLSAAQDVSPSVCVLLASTSAPPQWARVTAVTKVARRTGLYSVVTQAAYPVVSGVVASPFASSHLLGRALHAHLLPLCASVLRLLGLQPRLDLVADGAASVLNTPALNRALRGLQTGWARSSALLVTAASLLSGGAEL